MAQPNRNTPSTPPANQRRRSFSTMLSIALLMGMLMFVLIAAARNVTYTAAEMRIPLLSTDKTLLQQAPAQTDCLLLYEEDSMGLMGLREMRAILSQLRVGFDELSCDNAAQLSLAPYSTLVLSVTHYQLLGELLGEIKTWVKAGGRLMILYPPEINGSFQSLFELLGIRDCGSTNVRVETLCFAPGFMLGGDNRTFPITDAYDSSISVSLESRCQVFAQTEEEYPTPLIWRHRVGDGVVVMDNLNFLEKGYRGLHAGAYSLLDDAFLYPVINASVFYIDDFPSPVPDGYAQYIERDYHVSVKDFYTSYWWADIYNLAKDYGIQYTGLVIEQYSDQIMGTFQRNSDLERYQYFGNMLLDMGGEIGLHGYNHMPLVLENFDYEGLFDSYSQWPSYEDMHSAVTELVDFCARLYPDRTFQVYVPPSNIISAEGIDMLATDFPDIKTIAAVYLPGELAYTQDYQVEDNGLISTPRVISGYVLDDYMQLVALSELNFHLISSHFQHPDDVLDEDRGAELGWAKLLANLKDYVHWLYTSVPSIRSLTGSETAAAVQRYDYVQLVRSETDHGIALDLTNFYDEAWFMLRLNEEQLIESVTGGELTQVSSSMYLLCATQAHVDIRFE
ncbi:MAG: DUF2194 domain-containing protein [Aristaeellaceae bacterium]